MIERQVHEQTIIPFRPRQAKGSGRYWGEPRTMRPLRPRYRPFHQPPTRARLVADERDIWQLLSPHVAEFLRNKLEMAKELTEEAAKEVDEMSDQ